MGRWLVAVALALVGCVDPDLVPCGSLDCPAGNVCVSQDRCATVEEISACTGKAEASDCIVGTTTGVCIGGMCTTSVCGNGLLEGGEVCDDGNRVSGDGCSYDCLSKETCGNGYVDYVKGEMCDDGNGSDGDACENDCTLPKCGNNIIDVGEVCDDGNNMDGDGCSRDCKSTEKCGNGILDPGEECDDGNRTDHDGCQSTCKRERCGDGITDPADTSNNGVAEECDDDNDVNTDGCLNSCKLATCGDGVIETGIEQCDDGNANNNDGCRNNCTLATCGDGVIEAGVEACDDGSANSDTGCCLTNCTLPRCGDGKVECHETCDPLDPALGSDSCFDDCQLFCRGSDKGGVSFIVDAAGTLSDKPPSLIVDSSANASTGVGFLDATFGGLTTTVSGETPCGVQTFSNYTPEVIDKSNGAPILLQYWMINDTSQTVGGLTKVGSGAGVSFSADELNWSGEANYCSKDGGSGTWVPEVTLTVTDACHRTLNYPAKLADTNFVLPATDWPVCVP
jgi:cysteine-rich repeat protein